MDDRLVKYLTANIYRNWEYVAMACLMRGIMYKMIKLEPSDAVNHRQH